MTSTVAMAPSHFAIEQNASSQPRDSALCVINSGFSAESATRWGWVYSRSGSCATVSKDPGSTSGDGRQDHGDQQTALRR
jgi:hypothetical protein